MSFTADRFATTSYRVRRYEEPFRQYRVDWRQKTSARTDTPDLIAMFKEVIENMETQRMVDAEALAIHADLAEASFRALPAE